MSLNAAVHRFEYDGWQVLIELEGSSSEDVTSGPADLHLKGQRKCRIALAGRHTDGASAISSLAERSRAFIDEWSIQ
jgi:hypothetical protein